MGSTLNASPNSPSSSKAAKAKSARAATALASTTLALGVIAALLGAAPASAKTSLQGGVNVCKAALQAQTPAPSSLRLDSTETKAFNDTLVYAYRVKAAGDDKTTTVTCTVDRNTNTASLTAEAAPPTTLATR